MLAVRSRAQVTRVGDDKQPSAEAAQRKVGAVDEMAWIPGGTFRMGSEDFYPEEAPIREVSVDGFWMDTHPVTAAEFRRFVRTSGYTTLAERPLDPNDYPEADPELLVPGSLVFRKTSGPVALDDVRNWWEYVPGCVLEEPWRPGHDDERARPPSRRPCRVRGCRGVCDLGGEGVAYGSRVGARRAGRARRGRLCVGRRALP